MTALKAHQGKGNRAKEELQNLADNPSQLRSADLKKAQEAIEHVLKELDQQLHVFLEYVGRVLKV